MSRVGEVIVVYIQMAEVKSHFFADTVEEGMAVVHPAEVEDVSAVDDRSGFLADLPADVPEAGDVV